MTQIVTVLSRSFSYLYVNANFLCSAINSVKNWVNEQGPPKQNLRIISLTDLELRDDIQ
jgi:hypothetical protein